MTKSTSPRSVQRLSDCPRPLVEAYDLGILDLDGVVYVGGDAVPGAVDALRAAEQATMRLAYITNNASRPPGAVVERLRKLGVPVNDGEVVTSAQAAARLVASLVPDGSAVLVVGGEGLVDAIAEYGLSAVRTLQEAPAAVVQGFHPDIGWSLLAEAAYAVATGLPWVASNTDRTIPTARGIAPGNGTLVDAVATATGRRPVVAGKPEVPLFEETVLRVGGEHHLVVGDRLDTDIEGANNVSTDSMLVLTGVSTLAEAITAEPLQRPTYIAADLGGLHVAHEPVVHDGDTTRCADVAVRIVAGAIELVDGADGRGPARSTALLRAALARGWHDRDHGTDRDVPDVSAIETYLHERR